MWCLAHTRPRHGVPIDRTALLAHTFRFFADFRLPRVLVDMVTPNAALPFVSLHRCTYRADFVSMYTCINSSKDIENKSHEGALAKLNTVNFYTT